MFKPICQHCVAEVQLFKWCQNLSAGTVLQRCSCLSGVETYLTGLCCRGAAVKAVTQPICWHCAAGVQLFKQCRNLSAGTVLQGCSCLSGVKTYLLGLCCRGASVKAVFKPICRHCVAEVQLFKRCQNLSSGTVLQRGSCLNSVPTYLPGTVLQGCSCISGVAIYLPALCCRGAAVQVVLKPTCRHCAAGVQLFKWCQNLSAGTVLQRYSCLSSVETYLPALCCRGAAV